MVDPVTGVGLFNAVSTALKTVTEVRRNIKTRKTEEKLAALYDTLWELKTAAGRLEDENRALTEKLRFKSDHYEFRYPFWYEKGKEQSFCPKCFARKSVSLQLRCHSQVQMELGRYTGLVWCVEI